MSGFELNKIAGAVIMAGLIAMLVGKTSTWLYGPHSDDAHGGHGEHAEVKRGYQIDTGGEGADLAGVVEQEEEPINLPLLLASADVEAGKKSTKKCVACHSFESGGAHKVGPNLWNLVGGPIAHHADYNYSSALKDKGGDWTYDNLYAFLHKPKDFAKGTKMAFAGIKKPEDLADLIVYLRTQHSNPPALPTAPPPAAVVEPAPEEAETSAAE